MVEPERKVHVQMPDTKLVAEMQRALAPRRRRSKPRAVLFGNYGQGNIGDEAILRGILTQIDGLADITVISKAPERVRTMHGVQSESALTARGMVTLLRSDVVLIGGGGIFGNDMTLLPQLLPPLGLAMRVLGKRTAFVAIGAYETTPGWLKRVLRTLAAVSTAVTVRDYESALVLGRERSVLVSDPGAAIDAAPPAEALAFESAHGFSAGALGFALKPAADPRLDERQLDTASLAAEQWLTMTDRDVVMFLFSERGNSGLGMTRTDATLAEQVRSRMSAPERVHVVPADTSPWLMKALVGRCTAMVAHRLHAQMFAHEMQVPFLGLTWERKSDVFLAGISAPTVDLRDDVDTDMVARWLTEISTDVRKAEQSAS